MCNWRTLCPIHTVIDHQCGRLNKLPRGRILFRSEAPMKGLFRVLIVAVACAVFSLSARAQFNGNIQGSLQDSSGASVPGADTTLTNLDTNVVHTTKSEKDGSYRFVSLAPGRYQVVVKASGFTPASVEVTLLTDQTVNVPMVLKVGSVTESVVVTTEAPL